MNFSPALQLIFTWQTPQTHDYLSVHLVLAIIRRHKPSGSRGPPSHLPANWMTKTSAFWLPLVTCTLELYLSGCNEGRACPVCLLRVPVAAFAQWTSSKAGGRVYLFCGATEVWDTSLSVCLLFIHSFIHFFKWVYLLNIYYYVPNSILYFKSVSST